MRHLRRVEAAQVDSCQAGAILEYIAHVRHVLCIEAAQVEFCQGVAPIEHADHVRHVLSIKAAQVEFCHALTIIEHTGHVRHVGRIKAAHVYTRQFVTMREHASHARHLAGVQVLDVRDGGQVRHAVEPVVGACRTGIGKRCIEYHLSHVGIGAISVPTRITISRIQAIGGSRATTPLRVIVERQRGVVLCIDSVSLLCRGGDSPPPAPP